MAVTTLDGQLDDDVLLDETEVLAFLADCDMAQDVNAIPAVSAELTMPQWEVPVLWSESSGSSSDNTTPETAAAPTLTRQKKVTWRQRQKDELLRLRALVTELTAQLDKVKLAAAGVRSTLPATRRTVDMAGTVHSRVIKLQTVALTQTAAQWKAIANQQSLLREKSTQDNARLRDALGHYLLQAKSVQRALKKRLQDEVRVVSAACSTMTGLVSSGTLTVRNFCCYGFMAGNG
ncbi:hypothetical protein BBJ28_00008046 [Nothophytophthora sp. Chile5]|nr:hypothetical protein BBJ28_00008046 [Nothophytophthora sp. Chile5]